MTATFTSDTTGREYRWVGITDECVQCEKCGKSGLKNTVVLSALDADGNHEDYVYYGSTCAARALGIKGGGRGVLNSARAAMDNVRSFALWGQETLASFDLPEDGDADEYTLHAARLRYQLRNRRGDRQQTPEQWAADTVRMMREHQDKIRHARTLGMTLVPAARVAAKIKIMRALETALLRPLSEGGSLNIAVHGGTGGQRTLVKLDRVSGAVDYVSGPLESQISEALRLARV